MCSGAGDTTQLVPGYPIRTPWDHSSVDSSPRPIAASHVLHRLLVPRHPPFALDNLTTKMLASTMQFTTNNQPTTPQRHPPPATTPTRMPQPKTVCRQAAPGPKAQPHTLECTDCSLRTQQGAQHRPPTAPAAPSTPHPAPQKPGTAKAVLEQPATLGRRLTSVSTHEHPHPTTTGRAAGSYPTYAGKALLRKEVIQPHLPVRLPCYDFVPIASPTFDSSLPTRGLGHRLRVLPTFVT
jgi:hypothetical protein